MSLISELRAARAQEAQLLNDVAAIDVSLKSDTRLHSGVINGVVVKILASAKNLRDDIADLSGMLLPEDENAPLTRVQQSVISAYLEDYANLKGHLKQFQFEFAKINDVSAQIATSMSASINPFSPPSYEQTLGGYTNAANGYHNPTPYGQPNQPGVNIYLNTQANAGANAFAQPAPIFAPMGPIAPKARPILEKTSEPSISQLAAQLSRTQAASKQSRCSAAAFAQSEFARLKSTYGAQLQAEQDAKRVEAEKKITQFLTIQESEYDAAAVWTLRLEMKKQRALDEDDEFTQATVDKIPKYQSFKDALEYWKKSPAGKITADTNRPIKEALAKEIKAMGADIAELFSKKRDQNTALHYYDRHPELHQIAWTPVDLSNASPEAVASILAATLAAQQKYGKVQSDGDEELSMTTD